MSKTKSNGIKIKSTRKKLGKKSESDMPLRKKVMSKKPRNSLLSPGEMLSTAVFQTFEVVYDDGLNIRSSPNRRAKVVGTLEFGDEVEAKEEKVYKGGETWIRHTAGWSMVKDTKSTIVFLKIKPRKKPKRLTKQYSFEIRLVKSPEKKKEEEELFHSRLEKNWRPVGIQNVGNTCYFNTTLQALFSSHHLAATMLAIDFNTINKAKERTKDRYSEKKDASTLKLKLQQLELFEALYKSNNMYHNLARRNKNLVMNFNEVLECFGVLYPEFRELCQHDAQESLMSFLDVLGVLKVDNKTLESLDHLFRLHYQVERKVHVGDNKKDYPIKTVKDSTLFLCCQLAVEIGKSKKFKNL
eukprot:UN27171